MPPKAATTQGVREQRNPGISLLVQHSSSLALTHSFMRSLARSLLLRRLDCFNDPVHDAWIAQSRCVAQAVFLTRQDLSQDSSHDLAGSSLGQIIDDEDGLRRGKWTDGFAYLQDEIFPRLLAGVDAVFQGDEGVDRLAGQLIIDAHHGGFGHSVVFNEGGFDFCRRQAMSRDVNDIIHTSSDPIVSFVITTSTIAGELSSS